MSAQWRPSGLPLDNERYAADNSAGLRIGPRRKINENEITRTEWAQRVLTGTYPVLL